jgi:acyl-CoA synthetase (NDP forming)
VAQALDPGLEPSNPIDAWGTGREAEEVFVECMSALADDPAIGAVAFCVDLTTEEDPDTAYVSAPLSVAGHTDKPLVVLGNVSTTIDPEQAHAIRSGGVPVLEGTETGLRAIGHLLAHHRRSLLPPLEARITSAGDPGAGISGEAAAIRVLDSYGIPVPAFAEVGSLEDAVSAASRLGFPVVLKSAEAGDHKSDLGGVVSGIGSDAEMTAAYQEMAERIGPRALVAEMIEPGVEVGLGMITDPQFGPVVILAAGGTLIEVIRDRVALLPPVDPTRARLAMEKLSMWPLFEGARGGSGVDLDALCDVVARFSELVVDSMGGISSIDVNPVIAGPNGSVAVDALMKGM